ncbi:MAG: ATP-binding cassette domain-containing protein [Acidobacteriota bacterium]|nr:ATP-binding cassette domain-containing protein [Acidobacteriota bacterium]
MTTGRRGLRFAKVGRSFGDHVAVQDLELDCPAGVLTCLVGPNGAGKSTALALAAGLLAPTAGAILFDEILVRPQVPAETTGYLPQRSAFHPSFTVGEVLHFTRVARGSSDEERSALEVTGLGEVLDRFVGELSGGWVRRLGLLSALLGSPTLLLLDEPFVGLDPETHDRLLSHLRERLESGATIVTASHDFEVLDPFGPRVAVLDEGRLRLIETVSSSDVSRPASSSRVLYRRALSGEPD